MPHKIKLDRLDDWPLTTQDDLIIAGASGVAARLAKGSDGQVLTVDPTTHHLVWATPSGGGGGTTVLRGTATSTSTDSHTTNNTWEDVNSMTVTLVPGATADLVCEFTAKVAFKSANWQYYKFRFLLDGSTGSEEYGYALDTNPTNNPIHTFHMHTEFAGVSAASHAVKVQWHDNGSSQDLDITTRRLTVLSFA